MMRGSAPYHILPDIGTFVNKHGGAENFFIISEFSRPPPVADKSEPANIKRQKSSPAK